MQNKSDLKPVYPADETPGHSDLVAYRAHGSGAFLFHAYLERRKADKTTDDQRRAELVSGMEAGMPFAAFDAACAELIRLDILSELDPLIADVARVCSIAYTQSGERLVDLNAALRIGREKTQHDAEIALRTWAIEERWKGAYLVMEYGQAKAYRSQRLIANEIASEFGISKSAAINILNALKQREPWQARWIKQVDAMAKAKVSQKSRKEESGKSARAPVQKKAISFGRKRTAQ